MRKLLLALPLASLVVLAGCCGNECYTCPTGVAAAPVVAAPAADKKVASADFPAGSTITEAQWEAMVAADAARGVPAETEVKAVAVAEKAEPQQAVETAPAVKPVAAASSSKLPTIPTVSLPEGWAYMSEVELSGGELNIVPIDQMYSQVASENNEG